MNDEPSAWRRRLEAATADPESAPLQIALWCVAELGISGAGVSVATAAGSRAILCATDDRAQRVEDLQFTLGVGPCIDAVDQGVAVLLPDLRRPADLDLARWPGFLDAVDVVGIRALFSLPLRIGAIRIGALDLHRIEPGALSPDDLRHAFAAADVIASVLLDVNVPIRPAAGDLPWPGLSSGVHVHQATGMVREQLGVGIADALLALRARAYAEGRTLSELATDVVARRLRFGEGDR